MITGSLVPNITMFDADGQLDIARTKWHMRWMFERGVDGLFLTGSYGSGPLMTVDERISVYAAAKEVAADFSGKTLIAHVGSIDTASTVALARAAEQLGMDAVGAVPPFYYKHSEDLVLQFYRDLIESTSLPVYAYNNPETSRFSFTAGTVRKLQDMGLAGMKDSPLEVGFVSRVYYENKLAGRQFQVILGTSKGWLPFYYMGVRAMIAGMSNWAPEIMTALTRATFDGDQERSERLYVLMLDLSAKMHFSDSTIVSLMGLYARGYDAGYPRKPMQLPPFDSPKYAEIRGWLEDGFAQAGLALEVGQGSVV
ncbi:MAG: dihydrodipicolinate synthase family protein [Anaerolineae bacterium]|nr:dihydrodipicolinate synthase family protein [Anaerolineae bacterium]